MDIDMAIWKAASNMTAVVRPLQWTRAGWAAASTQLEAPEHIGKRAAFRDPHLADRLARYAPSWSPYGRPG
jgi:hypothetical protein